MQTILQIMIHASNIFPRARLVETRHVTEYSPASAKTRKYEIDIPQSSKMRLLGEHFEG